MAATYEPVTFIRKDGSTEVAETPGEYYQLLWEGATIQGPAPEMPPFSQKELDDLHARFAELAHTHGVDDLEAFGTPSATTYLRGDGTWSTPGTEEGGAADHGALGGLADDDHPQYALTDGSRGNFADPVHTHVVTDVVATGTPDATTYLRGDGTWSTPAGGAGGGVTDHGALTGLEDDDHPQYARADGSRGDFAALNHGHPDLSPLTHTHDVGDVVATGTPDATTYLRGDGTWAIPAGGTGGGQEPLGIMYAGFADRLNTPCRLVFAGSSTTEATPGWVTPFVEMLQAAYPAGGSEAPVIYSLDGNFGTLSQAPGIHGYNVGYGGTRSDNYLTGRVPGIGAVNPRAMFHMIGANDYSGGIDPAVFKANVLQRLVELRAAIPDPCVHVMVQSFERGDGPFTYPWSAYGDALRELAETETDVVYIDVSGEFDAAGVPFPDSLDLLGPDIVHATPAGYAMLADLVRREVRVSRIPATVADAASEVRARYTSDTFSGANDTDIAGRTTDLELGGGKAKSWQSTPAAYMAITNGRLVRGTASTYGVSGFQMPTADYEASFRVIARHTSGQLLSDVRRDALEGGTGYRLQLDPNGDLYLLKRVTGVGTTTLAGPFATSLGDRIGIRAKGNSINLMVNGTAVFSITDTAISAPGYFTISSYPGTMTGFQLDDLIVDVLT